MATSNAAQFRANMKRRAMGLSRDLDRAAKTTAYKIRADAQRTTPVDTGKLRKGWQGPNPAGKWSYKVENDVEYAMFVEKGTRKMAGRHMLANAVHKNEKTLKAAVNVAIRKAAR